MNINLLREGDKITLKNKAMYVIESFEPIGGVYRIGFVEQFLEYNLDGTCLQHSSLDIDSYELVAREDDDVPYYIPKIEIVPMPVLEINGEQMIISTLVQLNDLEVKEPQILKASYKPTVTAHLLKKLGREIKVIKTEHIICETEEEANAEVEKINNNFKEQPNEQDL